MENSNAIDNYGRYKQQQRCPLCQVTIIINWWINVSFSVSGISIFGSGTDV
jgi:hypothetical protein